MRNVKSTVVSEEILRNQVRNWIPAREDRELLESIVKHIYGDRFINLIFSLIVGRSSGFMDISSFVCEDHGLTLDDLVTTEKLVAYIQDEVRFDGRDTVAYLLDLNYLAYYSEPVFLSEMDIIMEFVDKDKDNVIVSKDYKTDDISLDIYFAIVGLLTIFELVFINSAFGDDVDYREGKLIYVQKLINDKLVLVLF